MADLIADLEHRRLDADKRYNDALTMLDRAIVAVGERPSLDRDALAELATALIVFLQQITAFVETKDRELQARFRNQLDALAPTVAAVDELKTRVSVLQRTIDSMSRSIESRDAPPAAVGTRTGGVRVPPEPGSTAHSVATDVTYVAFEDEFRGSEERIEARLREYLPLFADASNVVDIGCGRGEFLSALGGAGISARGVDANGAMAAIAQSRGADAVHGDALEFLDGLADESVGGLMAAQVVEHLEPSYLLRLLATARRKLKAGAPIVVETINAACWLAFFSSYIRDLTHVRPVHPETLQYLLRANGFERVSIRYSAPVPDQMKMQPIQLGAEIMASSDPSARALVETARTLNANAAILNNLMFSNLDYAAVGYRS